MVCGVNFYTEAVSPWNLKGYFFIWNFFWYFVSAVNAAQNYYQNFQISSSIWNIHLAPVFSTIKLLTWNATLCILCSWLLLLCLGCEVTGSKVSVYSVYLVRKVLGALVANAIAAVLNCNDCNEMWLPINPSHAGCAVQCSVFRVLLWLLMQWGSAEASPSGGGVEGKLWVCRWRCFLQLQNPFKFVHFNKGKQSRPWCFCFRPTANVDSLEIMIIYKCTVL